MKPTPVSKTTDPRSPVGRARICPYLGLKGFPSVALGYPAFPNACHCGGQPELVPLDRQQGVCLAGAYQGCPGLRSRSKDG